MRRLTVAGVGLHVEDTGGDGPALLFVNSLGTDLRLWSGCVSDLRGMRLIRFDMRGHGLSDCPPGPYTIDDLIDDAAGLLDYLDLRRAVVVGLSVGGMVAQGLAARRPDLVSALVLSNTAARLGTAEIWAARIASIRAGGLSSMSDEILARWFAPPFRSGAEVGLWRAMLERTPVDGYLGVAAALRAADLTAETARLTLPALAIAGSEDGSSPPEHVRATAALIPGSRFEVISDVGHLPPVEAPKAFLSLLTGFLEEISA
ncbi:MAG: 3-oxoadipate enol-lactonase [Pseudomonadota bacterium]